MFSTLLTRAGVRVLSGLLCRGGSIVCCDARERRVLYLHSHLDSVGLFHFR